jgi:hypothetical protein
MVVPLSLIRAGGFNGRDQSQTTAQQLAYYKKVYAAVQDSMEAGGAVKGILFWRWAATDPTIVLGTPEQAATIGEPSRIYCIAFSGFHRLSARSPLALICFDADMGMCPSLARRCAYRSRSPSSGQGGCARAQGLMGFWFGLQARVRRCFSRS